MHGSPEKEIIDGSEEHMKQCDHTNVGILIYRDGDLLLIERKKPPFGFTPPTGHLDGDGSFEDAARRYTKEKVGLDAGELELIAKGRKDNPCRREDGSWHYWKIYKVDASGAVVRSEEETKRADFFSKESVRALSERTEQFLKGHVTEEEWQRAPGIEPVWLEWFKELHIKR